MSNVALSVDNLSKHYWIGQRGRYKAARDVLARAISAPLRGFRERRSGSRGSDFLWALKDVTFDVKEGEAVGVIGRNGAGKSTLLKILARITRPTRGLATVSGRVGSLLEVGTGFHPELTGRENIFLNGAVLGMGRREIRHKFDEIVAFAETENFIDTPVKHYSSGMQVRLAFAVAAHLDPEIFIIDEVLAVGDVAFQKKCLGKMNEKAHEGRTILFVSHNMAAVEALTDRCIVLESGKLVMDADSRSSVAHYLRSSSQGQGVSVADWRDRAGVGGARITHFRTLSTTGEQQSHFRPGEPIKFVVGVEFAQPIEANLGISIETDSQMPLFTSHLSDSAEISRWGSFREFEMTLSHNYLRQGSYLGSLAVFSPDRDKFHDVVYHLPAFDVEGNGETDAFPLDERWGDLYLPCEWKVLP